MTMIFNNETRVETASEGTKGGDLSHTGLMYYSYFRNKERTNTWSSLFFICPLLNRKVECSIVKPGQQAYDPRISLCLRARSRDG